MAAAERILTRAGSPPEEDDSSGSGGDKKFHLNLENFDGDDVPDDCPYVLTSPRSLEACKRLRVQPIDLLPCSLDELRDHLAREGDLSLEALKVLRDAEEERRETLENCRRLRQRLIEESELIRETTAQKRKEDNRLREWKPPHAESVADSATLRREDSGNASSSLGSPSHRSPSFISGGPSFTVGSDYYTLLPEADQGKQFGHRQRSSNNSASDIEIEEMEFDSDHIGQQQQQKKEEEEEERHEQQSHGTRTRSSSNFVTFRDQTAGELTSRDRAGRQSPRHPPTLRSAIEIKASLSRRSTAGRLNETPESERFLFIKGNPSNKSSQGSLAAAVVEAAASSSRPRRRCHNPSRPRCSSSDNANAAGRRRHRRQHQSGAARIHPPSPQRSSVDPCSTSWLRELADDNSIPPRDLRHLEAFAQKQRGALCAELRSAQRHEDWRREHERRGAAKREREEALRTAVEEKHRREAEDCVARLEEARQRFTRSQEHLKNLIREKEEKRDSLKREREKQRDRSVSQRRAAEEDRRMAVEEALDELMASDTHYRRELNVQISSRIAVAEGKRRARTEELKEAKLKTNSEEQEQHRIRFFLLQKEERERLRSVRLEIEKRQERAERSRRERAALADQCKEPSKRWESRNIKAHRLRGELEDKMESWRSQVIAVQSVSIREAEAKARGALEQRRERVASETLKRRERHAKAMEDVERDSRAWESESRRSLGEKMSKVERIMSERERSRKRSREHAHKMAEMREAIRERFRPDTFDQRVMRAELETRTTSRRLQ